MSTKRQTRPPAGDNLEFIFPDEPAETTAAEQAADPPNELEDAAPLQSSGDLEGAPEVGDDIEFGETRETETDEMDPLEADDDELEADDDDEGEPLEAEADDDEGEPLEAGTDDDEGEPLEAGTDDDETDPEEFDAPAELEAIDLGAPSNAPDDEHPAITEEPDLALPEEDDAPAEDWAHDLEALGAPQALHATRVLHVEDTMTRPYGFSAIARSLLAIVALHALIALTIRVAPAYASAWLSRIPLAGSILAHEPTIMQSIELRNVAGNFQQLRNARRVFVITGEAVNRSPASIERIEVQGTLYGGDGRVDQKVVNAGNRTALRDLSAKEIAMLQRLDPRRIVAPGESSTFLIVFLEPPGNVREFSSRVLNARPSRRLAQPSTDPLARRPDSVG